MKRAGLLPRAAVVLLGLGVVTVLPAHAYLDPGTGSYAVQIAIAAALGGLVAVRAFWARITSFFGSRFRKKD